MEGRRASWESVSLPHDSEQRDGIYKSGVVLATAEKQQIFTVPLFSLLDASTTVATPSYQEQPVERCCHRRTRSAIVLSDGVVLKTTN